MVVTGKQSLCLYLDLRTFPSCFTPCPVDKQERVSSWADKWLLAKVNPPQQVRLSTAWLHIRAVARHPRMAAWCVIQSLHQFYLVFLNSVSKCKLLVTTRSVLTITISLANHKEWDFLGDLNNSTCLLWIKGIAFIWPSSHKSKKHCIQIYSIWSLRSKRGLSRLETVEETKRD